MMMRILYVTSYYKPAYVYGGPVRSISQLCEALVQLGTSITVFTTNANGKDKLEVPLGHPVNLNGVEVYYYPVVSFPPRSFFYSPSLSKACRQKIPQFDLVILEGLFSYVMGPAVKACIRSNVPFIVPLRGQLLPWSLRQKRLKKQLYLNLIGRTYLNCASALHCTVPAEAEAVVGLKLRAPSFIVPNGIDSKHYANLPSQGSMREKLGISEDAHILLFLGRLHHKKRPDIAVETLAAVQSLPLDVHLVMAGPDETQIRSQLQSQAQRLGCANRLHFTGLLEGDEVLSILADVDLLLMPSEPSSENFGRSAVEAMAAGLPVLVSEGVPVGEWAEEADAGRMIPCTVENFRREVRQMLASPEQLKLMGQRGQAMVADQFDALSVARQMLTQYQAIVASGRPLNNTVV